MKHILIPIYLLTAVLTFGQQTVTVTGDTLQLESQDLTKSVILRTDGSSGEIQSNGDLMIRGKSSDILMNSLAGDGNGSIGAVFPNERLNVDGAIRIGNSFGTNNGAIRYTGLDFEGYSGGSWMSLTNGGNSSWNTNGNGIDYSSGNVGIGINNPLEKLHLDGAIRLGNTANTGDGTIRFNGTDFEGYSGGSWQSLTGGGSSGSSPWDTNPDGIHYLSGRVGIANNHPDEALDINGALKLSNGSIGSDNGVIRYTGSDLEGRVGGNWLSLTTGNSPWNTNGTDIYYNVVGNEVGIGTENPTSVFHVIGDNEAGETVDITTTGNLLQNADVLNIGMGANSDDGAQFIECRRFADLMFRVDGDGSVWAGETNFRVVGSTGEVYITNATAGVILTSPNGNCWRMTVDNTGVPSFTNVTCP